MKFDVEQDVLNAVLTQMRGVPPRRTTVPVYQHALIEAFVDQVRITTTSNSLKMRSSVPAQVKDQGACTVPFDKFSRLVSSLSGTLKFSLKDHKLTVRSRHSRSMFSTLEADQFPEVAMDGSTAKTELDAAFKDSLARMLPAIMDDEVVMQSLSGVYIRLSEGYATMVSTDKMRMVFSRVQVGGSEEREFVLPQDAAKQVLKLNFGRVVLGVPELGVGVTFHDGDTLITSQLIDGAYPSHQIERVMFSEQNRQIVLNKDYLKTAVERALIFARDHHNILVFSIKDGEMAVVGDVGDASEGGNVSRFGGVEYEGEFKWAMNGVFVLDMLKTIRESEVVLGATTNERPVIFMEHNGDPHYRHAIMPMKLPMMALQF